MKKIVYLGGYFQCEHSMQVSFRDAGNEMMFYFDTSPYGIAYMFGTACPQYRKDYPFFKVVEDSLLQGELERYRPDVIIHRFYKHDSVMHHNSSIVAKRLGIPLVLLKMETTGNETSHDLEEFANFDVLLYAHNLDYDLMSCYQTEKRHMYFYPYGVSNFERNLHVLKTKNIGSFGVFRLVEQRADSLDIFLDGIARANQKLHVFNAPKMAEWSLYDGRHRDLLVCEQGYSQEQTTEIMNQFKIAVNFETMHFVEGAYSHKMWQSVGCGIPTLTIFKHSLVELFGDSPNPILVRDASDVRDCISILLNSQATWNHISRQGEEYIHEKFDWWNGFDEIMKKEGIWKSS